MRYYPLYAIFAANKSNLLKPIMEINNNTKYYFAVDLGATSGRTILGSLNDGKFELSVSKTR